MGQVSLGTGADGYDYAGILVGTYVPVVAAAPGYFGAGFTRQYPSYPRNVGVGDTCPYPAVVPGCFGAGFTC